MFSDVALAHSIVLDVPVKIGAKVPRKRFLCEFGEAGERTLG